MPAIWPIVRALPLVIAFVSIIALGVQLSELWLTKSHLTMASTGLPEFPGERIAFMSAFMRVIIDFTWNLGWAAVVLAAVKYVDSEKES